MAGTAVISTIKHDVSGAAPTFRDGAGNEIGQLTKAWVNFNGTGIIAARASFNISSLTDNNTGGYSISFTNALADANYSFVFSGGGTSGGETIRLDNPAALTTTGAGAFLCRDTAQTRQDWDYVFASVFR